MNTAHSKEELRRVARALRARVEFDAASGASAYPRGRRGAASAAGVSEDAAVEHPAEVGKVTGASGDLFVSPRMAEVTSLEDLRGELGDCQRCKLAGHRTNIVFGVGNPRATLMFVGEGPGHDEDMQAEPFVGRAGQLLTEIITKGMGLRRADVYIANVIKCRPPGNRNPEPDEVAACQPFLQRQIELIRPAVLVALGTFAAQALLRTRAPISRLRGQWHDYHGIRLMPTFHPAYLLRNPHDKRIVWQDIKAVLRELGLRQEVR
jgi:DNA polymerase